MSYKDFLKQDTSIKKTGFSYKTFLDSGSSDKWEENRSKEREANFKKIEENKMKPSKPEASSISRPNLSMLNQVTNKDKEELSKLDSKKTLYEKTLKPTVDILKKSGEGVLKLIDSPRNALAVAADKSGMYKDNRFIDAAVVTAKAIKGEATKEDAKALLLKMGENPFKRELKPENFKKAAEGFNKGITGKENISTLETLSPNKKVTEAINSSKAAIPLNILADTVGDPLIGITGVSKAAELTKAEKQMRNVAELGQKALSKGKIVLPEAKAIEEVSKIATNEPSKDSLYAVNPALRPKLDPIVNDIKFTTPDTLSHVSTGAKETESILSKIDKAYKKTVDNLYGLKKFSNEVKTTADKDPYVLGLNSRNADMTAATMLKDRMVDSKGNTIGKSLADTLTKIPNGKDREFADYLINRHSIDWIKQDKKVFADDLGMTPELAAKRISEYEAKYPEFKKMGDEFVNFRQNLGKNWLVDTGFLSPDQWAKYVDENPNYVPFRREFSDIEKGGMSKAKGGFVNQTSGIKTATGSERKILNPIETTIEDVDRYVKSAKRNEVGQTIVQRIKENPEALKGWAEIVKEPKEGLIVDVNKILQEEGIDGVIEKFNQPFDTVFNKNNLSKDNIVSVFVDGKPVHLKINDPELLDALTSLSPKTQNEAIKIMSGLSSVMKTLTTGLNPMFGLMRNIWRDIPTGFVNSKTNPVYRPDKYAKDLVSAVVDMIGDKEAYKSFKNMGGGGHASSISSDRNILKETKAQILPGYYRMNPNDGIKNGILKPIGRVLNSPVQRLEQLNNVLETAPRLAEYKRVVKQGGNTYGSRVKGLYEANDLTTNFSRHGDLTKAFDSFTPYLNAAVQGLDKTIRTYKDNPVKAVTKSVMAVTVPSMVLYAVNHNDPNYQMLSDYQKDNFFNIPKGDGTFIKIPKPREIGTVFGALPERLMRKWVENDPEAFKRFSETLIQNWLPPDPYHDNIAAPMYNTFGSPEGRDWRGNPIVNQSLLGRTAKYQYDENTSEPAKFIGSKLNVSPKKIDAVAKSYLGGVAQLGIPATTKGKKVSDTLKSQMTVDPVYSNDILNEFYDKYSKLQNAANNKDFLTNKNKDTDKKETTPEEYQVSIMNQYKKEIDDLNSQIKTELSKDKQRELRKRILDIAKEAINNPKKVLDITVTYDKKKVVLTGEKAKLYQEKSDKYIKQAISNNRLYKFLKPDEQKNFVKKVTTKAHEQAKEEILK